MTALRLGALTVFACCFVATSAGCARILGLTDDYHQVEESAPRDAGVPPPPDAFVPTPPDAGPLSMLPTGKLLYHRYTEYYAGDSEMFVVGEGKAEVVRQVLRGPLDPFRLPAQLVRPVDGEYVWIVDRAAASLCVSATSA